MVTSGQEMLTGNHYKGLMYDEADSQIGTCSARFERVDINVNRNWFWREWNPIWLRMASNSNSTRVDFKMNRDSICHIVEATCLRLPSVLACLQLATNYYLLLVLLLPRPNTCEAGIILHSRPEYDAQPKKKEYERPKGHQRRLLLSCGAIKI